MLEVSALNKNFGTVPVLHDINFSVGKGMLAAILGASGSGKTTILRLIAGFLRPDGGQISLGGVVLASPTQCLRPEQRGIGYVAQEGALFPHLTVGQNISFGLKRSQRRDQARVAQLLEMVGLPAHYGQRPPQALSGGEQQRVALARALAPNPRLLLLDEPFSALDAGLRAETRAAVMQTLKAVNAMAVLVTHDQDEALSMGQMVGVMRQGRLLQWATPETLYRSPVSPEIAGFVGEAVFLPARVQGASAFCALGEVMLSTPLGAAMDSAKLMIRPEQIRLTALSSAVKARVMKVTYYGHDAAVDLQLCQDEAIRVTARVAGCELPAMGQDIGLSIQGPVMAYPPV